MLLAAAVVGLVAATFGPLIAAATALGLAATARVLALVRSPPLALAVGAVALIAGLLGSARVDALDRTSLTPLFGQTVHGEATVLTAPRRDAFGGRRVLVRWRGDRVLVRLPSWRHDPLPQVGDIVRVVGRLRAPDLAAGAADAHGTLQASQVELTHRRRGGPLGVVDGVRRRSESVFERALPRAEAALLRGMVLGQDEALDDDARDTFRASGLAHLVAASGQNIMLLVALAIGVSMVAGVGFRARWALALGLIVLYVPLAGGQAPIQRAAVMGTAMVAARLAGRPSSRWYAVLLAAATTLAYDPRSVGAVGWQLSFAAVVGMGVLAEPVKAPLRRRGVPAPLAEAFAVTVAATLATAPLLALHFGRVSLVSLPANVLAAPAVPLIMWLGMVAAAAAQVAPGVGVVIAGAAALPVGYLVGLARTAASMPVAEAALPAVVVTLVCAVVAWLIVRHASPTRAPAAGPRRRSTMALAAACALAAVAVGGARSASAPPLSPGQMRVTALDIGQGDATLVQVTGHAVLVDAGPVGGPVLEEMREAGVHRLDALVITHAQADHDGGVPAVLDDIPVGLVLDGRADERPAGEDAGSEVAPLADSSRAIDASIATHRVRAVAAHAGQRLQLGELRLDVLWPPAGAAPPGTDPNDRAVVLTATAHGSRALLTADAESPVLAPLDLPPVDVLKVSHHGSADEGLPALLERLRPRVALVEVGRGNTYGHPVPATVAALQATVPEVRRTDRDGTVRVDLDGGAVRALATG